MTSTHGAAKKTDMVSKKSYNNTNKLGRRYVESSKMDYAYHHGTPAVAGFAILSILQLLGRGRRGNGGWRTEKKIRPFLRG